MENVSAQEARNRFPELLDAAVAGDGQFEIAAENGSAVLMGVDVYTALCASIAVLSDPQLLESHENGLAEIEHGSVLDVDSLHDAMNRAGRNLRAPALPESQPYRLVVAASVLRMLTEFMRAPDALAVGEILTGPLVVDPYDIGVPVASAKGLIGHTLNLGAYRIMFVIVDTKRTVEVTTLDFSSNAYADWSR